MDARGIQAFARIDLISAISYVFVMGQMMIRNIDDTVIGSFKKRAAVYKTSAEEEVRRTMAASASFDKEALIAQLDAFVASLPPQTGPSSTEMLRADRDRDEQA